MPNRITLNLLNEIPTVTLASQQINSNLLHLLFSNYTCKLRLSKRVKESMHKFPLRSLYPHTIYITKQNNNKLRNTPQIINPHTNYKPLGRLNNTSNSLFMSTHHKALKLKLCGSIHLKKSYKNLSTQTHDLRESKSLNTKSSW